MHQRTGNRSINPHISPTQLLIGHLRKCEGDSDELLEVRSLYVSAAQETTY